MFVRQFGKSVVFVAVLSWALAASAEDPAYARTDDGVVFKGVVIHNVMDLVEGSGGRYEFRRAGAAVHEHLSEMGRERNANNTGVELRFVLKGDTATIRLGGKTDDAVSQIHIHYGDILGDWPNCTRTVIGKDAEITISRQSAVKRSGDRFDPSVIRLVLPYGDLGIYDVTGNVEPPSASLLPKSTYLAYGSSITHGGNAYLVEECYASLVGEGLGADVRNLGYAGSAYLENEMADFLATQKFDYATLEMGVNVVDFMSVAEYESRVRYLVDKVAGSHPNAVILAIDIFGWQSGGARDGTARQYRAILKRVVEELGYPNVSYVNGLEILPDDTEISLGGGVHPTPKGHRIIAKGLVERFRQAADDKILRETEAVAKTMAQKSAELTFSVDLDARTFDAAFPTTDSERRLFVAYGATDGGSDMTAWDSVVCVSNVPAGTSSIKEIGLPDGFGESAPVMRIFIERAVNACDYLRNGLVAQYDALDNAGAGVHDPRATRWVDLKGGKDISLVSGDSVGDDYVEIGRTVHSVSGIFPAYGPMTMETDFTIASTDGGTGGFVPFNVPGIGGISFDRNSSNKAFTFRAPAYENRSASGIMWWDNPYGNFASFMSAGGSADISYTPNYDPNSVVYIDGAKRKKSSGPWGMAYNGDLTFYLGAAEATLKVRSIRLYNCELQESERIYNRTLDRMRFEGFMQASFYSVSADAHYVPIPLCVRQIIRESDGETPKALELAFSACSQARKVFLAWGKTDGGDEVSGWENAIELGTVSENAVSATLDIPAEHRTSVAQGGFRVFIQRAATAADYERDGLVALYDALENVDWGTHAASTNVWRDIVGGHDLALTADDHIGSDSIEVVKSAHAASGIFAAYGPMTLETSFKVTDVDSGVNAFAPFVVPAIGGVGCDTRDNMTAFCLRAPTAGLGSTSVMWFTGPYANLAAFRASGNFAAVSYTPNTDGKSKFYVDGTAYPDSAFAHFGSAYDGSLTFNLGTANSAVSVRTVRIYNRELDEDERGRNLAIDHERYQNGPLSVCECSAFVRPNPRGLCIVVR